ncbi:MAG: DUF5777 family beta-barrel protein [Thermoanaerobaculia bacterium]
MIDRRILAALLMFTATAAQGQVETKPFPPIPLGDVLLTLPTSHMPDRGTWEVKFAHRFNQSIDEGEAIHSLFGLDSGANVTMGASYVPMRDLQLSVVRSNVLDTYEASAKYLLFQQAIAVPLSAALRGGMDWRTERDLGDRVSMFAQAIVSRQFGRRLAVYAMPTFVTDAGRATDGDASVALFQHAFNVPVGAAFNLRRGMSFIVEVVPPNGDLPDEIDSDFGWAFGIKQAFGGHYFEVLLTNTNATTADQYVTSTYQGAPLRSGDIQLGFNIERRFGRRR